MIIDCISDLHGHFPKLDGGDLLIVAGDLTDTNNQRAYDEFDNWLHHQNYKKKIFIAGNHDSFLLKEKPKKYNLTIEKKSFEKFEYLCDSGTEFEGLKIWGSPWTRSFYAQNPKCKAFGLDIESQLNEKFDLIPDDIDILITHTPPYGILDRIRQSRLGSVYLRNIVLSSTRMPKLKLHVFGHIHECGGKIFKSTLCKFVNASIMDEVYDPVNQPVRIII